MSARFSLDLLYKLTLDWKKNSGQIWLKVDAFQLPNRQIHQIWLKAAIDTVEIGMNLPGTNQPSLVAWHVLLISPLVSITRLVFRMSCAIIMYTPCFHQVRTLWCYCTDKVYRYQLTLKSVLFSTLMEYIAMVNEMLLMMSGDIESNPGPSE